MAERQEAEHLFYSEAGKFFRTVNTLLAPLVPTIEAKVADEVLREKDRYKHSEDSVTDATGIPVPESEKVAEIKPSETTPAS